MWENPKFARLGFTQRLLFCALLDVVDDQGRMAADPIFVRAKAFPFDDLTSEQVGNDTEVLAANGSIILYENGNGDRILQITNWWKYQRPQWACPSTLPPPTGWKDRIRHRIGKKVISQNWNGCDETDAPAELVPSTNPVQPESVQSTPYGYDHGYDHDHGKGNGRGNSRPATQVEQPRENARASTPPPILVFRDLTQSCPAPGTPMWDAIANLPHNNGDMETWRKVIQEWMLRGFKTRNIAGMLDWFHNGIPPRGPAVTKSGNARKGTGVNIATDPDIRTAIRQTEERWEAEHGA